MFYWLNFAKASFRNPYSGTRDNWIYPKMSCTLGLQNSIRRGNLKKKKNVIDGRKRKRDSSILQFPHLGRAHRPHRRPASPFARSARLRLDSLSRYRSRKLQSRRLRFRLRRLALAREIPIIHTVRPILFRLTLYLCLVSSLGQYRRCC